MKNVLIRNEIRRIPPAVGAKLLWELEDNVHPVDDGQVPAAYIGLVLIHAPIGTIWTRPDGSVAGINMMTKPDGSGACRAALYTTATPWSRDEIRFMRAELKDQIAHLGGDVARVPVKNPHSERWAKLLGCRKVGEGCLELSLGSPE